MTRSIRSLLPARSTRNDEDRREWVDNNEGLYLRWQFSGLSMRLFVREFRAEIDTTIESALHPRGRRLPDRRVPVLCGCGWGSLSMLESEIGDCPVCGFDLASLCDY